MQALRPLSGGASRHTSSFDLVASDGTAQALIVQVDRGSSRVSPSSVEVEARLLDAASRAGVPVARLVATGRIEDTGQGWLVVERLDGEVLARRLLRDDAWRGARAALAGQCGAALAAIHRIDPATIPGLATRDPVSDPLGIL
ncbi:MAG TPA: phosphotransferase, partial [Acidimicrobiales bacterium]|nr:phosphotransferase [Acidimicrobiales bacterium]